MKTQESQRMQWCQIHTRLAEDREDHEAWTALEQRIRAWARCNIPTETLVDDVVGDACSSVLVSLTHARNAKTFGGFVLGHCLNARRHVRQVFRENCSSLEGIDVAEPEPEPESTVDDKILLRLRTALASLPDRQRQAVILRYFERLPTARIAAELGVSDVNARRIIFNGLSRLRQALRQ
jgi:RNA polymerase sigma factor (sigma-70 family)